MWNKIKTFFKDPETLVLLVLLISILAVILWIGHLSPESLGIKMNPGPPR